MTRENDNAPRTERRRVSTGVCGPGSAFLGANGARAPVGEDD